MNLLMCFVSKTVVKVVVVCPRFLKAKVQLGD